MVNEYEKLAEEKKRIEEERREIEEAKLMVKEEFERMEKVKKKIRINVSRKLRRDRRPTEDLWIVSVATLCGHQEYY